MRKDVIQHIVMKHLVSLKLFEGSVLESLASSDTSDIEIRKLELEFAESVKAIWSCQRRLFPIFLCHINLPISPKDVETRKPMCPR